MHKLLSLVACASLLTACQGSGYEYGNNPRTYQGAGLGTLLGAGVGSLTGEGSTERRQHATIGAGIGLLAGAAAGHYMDQQEKAMRQQLQGTGVQVQRQGDQLLLNMPSGITFAFDSSQIKPEFNSTLDQIAQVLNSYPSTLVDVVGHTDSQGTDAYNMKLSQARAQAVASRLTSQGVASERLAVAGMGERQPVTTNETEAGRAQNRRVEVKIVPLTK